MDASSTNDLTIHPLNRVIGGLPSPPPPNGACGCGGAVNTFVPLTSLSERRMHRPQTPALRPSYARKSAQSRMLRLGALSRKAGRKRSEQRSERGGGAFAHLRHARVSRSALAP